MIIRTNVTTRQNFDADGNLFGSHMPRASYKNTERVEWHLYSKTPLGNEEGVNPDEWTPFTGYAAGGIGAYLTSDNNYTHRVKGTLTEAVRTGAIDQVKVTFSGQTNATIAAAGSITFFAPNGEAETVDYTSRAFSGNICTFTLAEGTVIDREYAKAAPVDTAEAVYMQAVMSAEESDPNNGVFVFYALMFSPKMKQAVDYSDVEFLDNKGLELAPFKVEAGGSVRTLDRFVCDDFAIYSGIADTSADPQISEEDKSRLVQFVNACLALGLEFERRVLENGDVEIRTRPKASGGAWSEWVLLPTGAQGIPGYLTKAEDYAPEKEEGYTILTLVTYRGSLYQALEDVPMGESPTTAPEKWHCVAKGVKGDKFSMVSGNGAPSVTNEADAYIERTSGDFYLKNEEGKWEYSCSLKGADGQGITPQGEYSETRPYVKNDAAQHNYSWWRCKAPCKGIEPPELPEISNDYWDLLVAQGGAGTIMITEVRSLDPNSAPTVTELPESTDFKRVYAIGVPRGSAGPSGSMKILAECNLLPYGSDPRVSEMAGSTANDRIYKLSIPHGPQGVEGKGLQIDFTDTFANRSLKYAQAPIGTRFLATDKIYEADGVTWYQLWYQKLMEGDVWSDGVRLLAGPQGDIGIQGIQGIQGPAGENARVLEPLLYTSESILGGSLIITGTQAIAHVEVYDANGIARTVPVSMSPGNSQTVAILTDEQQGQTIIQFGSGVDTSHGGRIRFAQGIGEKSLYQLWLDGGHEGSQDDFLEWTRTGVSSYTYVRFAKDNQGTDFNKEPSEERTWRAEIHSQAPIANPTFADFEAAGAVWINIKGKDGTDGSGVDVNMTGTLARRSDYDGAAKGFRYIATDRYLHENGSEYQLWYQKQSDAFGDWSEGVILSVGPRGKTGETGGTGPEGKQGQPGANVEIIPDVNFLSERDPENPLFPYIYGGSLMINGTKQICSIELFDSEGNGVCQNIGTGENDIIVKTCDKYGYTLIYFPSTMNVSRGGRIRFAQGVKDITQYQEYLNSGGTKSYDEWLAMFHVHENLEVLKYLSDVDGKLCYKQRRVCNCDGSGGTDPEPGDAMMYYGYIPTAVAGDVYKVKEITMEMLTDARSSIVAVTPDVLLKTSLGVVPEGALVVVMIPTSSNLKASKFNGLNGQVAFAEDSGSLLGTGANGYTSVINNVAYEIYGEFKLSSAEMFIYVDRK